MEFLEKNMDDVNTWHRDLVKVAEPKDGEPVEHGELGLRN